MARERPRAPYLATTESGLFDGVTYGDASRTKASEMSEIMQPAAARCADVSPMKTMSAVRKMRRIESANSYHGARSGMYASYSKRRERSFGSASALPARSVW